MVDSAFRGVQREQVLSRQLRKSSSKCVKHLKMRKENLPGTGIKSDLRKLAKDINLKRSMKFYKNNFPPPFIHLLLLCRSHRSTRIFP